MKDSIAGGAVKEFTSDQVKGWKANGEGMFEEQSIKLAWQPTKLLRFSGFGRFRLRL